MPGWSLIKSCTPTMLRTSFLGFIAGVLPGAGASLGSFISYTMEKKLVDKEGTFGTGDPRGVAAPEAGNNAAAGGALVPMLALGVPGSGTTAVSARRAAGTEHHAGPAALHPAAGRRLGPYRGAVHRQLHAAGHEHPDDRPVHPRAC